MVGLGGTTSKPNPPTVEQSRYDHGEGLTVASVQAPIPAGQQNAMQPPPSLRTQSQPF